jgi:hypothetical protein
MLFIDHISRPNNSAASIIYCKNPSFVESFTYDGPKKFTLFFRTRRGFYLCDKYHSTAQLIKEWKRFNTCVMPMVNVSQPSRFAARVA